MYWIKTQAISLFQSWFAISEQKPKFENFTPKSLLLREEVWTEMVPTVTFHVSNFKQNVAAQRSKAPPLWA